MRIKQFKIKNYRSFTDDQELLLSDVNILIGPNNAGKSNLLQAIKLFFDAFEGAQNYHYNRDFPRDAPPGRTSMTTVFSLDVTNEDDAEIWNRYDRLRRKMKLPPTLIKDIPVNLQFSVGDKPTYSLFPGTSIPHLLRTSDDFQNWHQELINEILQKFNVFYIPADKELKHLFKDIVVWVLKREIADHVKPIFNVRREKARSLSGRQTHPATVAPAGSNRSSRGG
ncbi:MAG: AAA family ATPase, partial [Rhodoplanes sp.]